VKEANNDTECMLTASSVVLASDGLPFVIVIVQTVASKAYGTIEQAKQLLLLDQFMELTHSEFS
jgi:hypothetical protein